MSLYDFNIVLRVKLWETLEIFSRFARRFPTLTGTKTDEHIQVKFSFLISEPMPVFALPIRGYMCA